MTLLRYSPNVYSSKKKLTIFLYVFTSFTHYTPDLLLLCVTTVQDIVRGDRDYMDDQTSRREMRKKISLDTTTSCNGSIARMITYDISG